MAIIVFVALANLVAYQYAIGAIRVSLDDGVRAQSRAEAPAGECDAVANQALQELLGGSMAAGVSIICSDNGTLVFARADGTLQAFSPWVPDRDVSDMQATAVKDQLP